MTKTHWHVLGAGSIGCIFARALDAGGSSVTLILREGAPRTPFELERAGITSTLNAATTYPTDCAPISHLLVTTKAYDVVDALASVAPQLTNTAVLVLLVNGMGIAEHLEALYPDLDVCCGTTTEGAHRITPQHILHAGRGTTSLGKKGHHKPPNWFAAWEKGIQPCDWDSEIDAALWHKLAINATINPLTAVYGCDNGSLASRKELRQRVKALSKEVSQISYAAGYTKTAQTIGDAVDRVIASTAGNRSSMLQDVSAGRRTEIDYITGHLLNNAQRYGIEAPLNRALYEEVQALGPNDYARNTHTFSY